MSTDKLAAEGTHLRYVQDLVARAYVAMGPSGSNDDEHDLLAEFLEYAEDDIRNMGGEMPTQSEDDQLLW